MRCSRRCSGCCVPAVFFVGSDWMRGDEEAPGPEMQRWLHVVGLTFGMHSLPFYIDALAQAGSESITTRDRNEFLVGVVREDCGFLTGAGREELARRVTGDAEDDVEVWGALRKRPSAVSSVLVISVASSPGADPMNEPSRKTLKTRSEEV